MTKLLISMPNQLAVRMRAAIPSRQRSKTIAQLIEKEILKREQALYKCAAAVEKDAALNREMEDWDTTIGDGFNDGSW